MSSNPSDYIKIIKFAGIPRYKVVVGEITKMFDGDQYGMAYREARRLIMRQAQAILCQSKGVQPVANVVMGYETKE